MTAAKPYDAELAQKIDALNEKVNETNVSTTRQLERQSTILEDISRNFRDFSDRLRLLESDTRSVLTKLEARVDAAFRRIDDVRAELDAAKQARQKDIDELRARFRSTEECIPEKLRERVEVLEKVIPGLVMTNRILAVIAGLLVTSLFGLIWSLLTGQIVLQFVK